MIFFLDMEQHSCFSFTVPDESQVSVVQQNLFNVEHIDDLEKIQNVLLTDIEIEFAQCENFPQPIQNNTSVKVEPNTAHPLFGSLIFENDVS